MHLLVTPAPSAAEVAVPVTAVAAIARAIPASRNSGRRDERLKYGTKRMLVIAPQANGPHTRTREALMKSVTGVMSTKSVT